MDDFLPISDNLIKDMLYIKESWTEIKELDDMKIKFVLESYKKYQALDEKFNISKKKIKGFFNTVYQMLNMENEKKILYISLKQYFFIAIVFIYYTLLVPMVFLFIFGTFFCISKKTIGIITALIFAICLYFFVIKKYNI